MLLQSMVLFPYSQNRPACNTVEEPFSVTEVKKWARDDLTETISWLESQEEKVRGVLYVLIPKNTCFCCLTIATASTRRYQANSCRRSLNLFTRRHRFP